jgi:hypothetical protein
MDGRGIHLQNRSALCGVDISKNSKTTFRWNPNLFKKLTTFSAHLVPKILKKIATVKGINNLKFRSFIDKL